MQSPLTQSRAGPHGSRWARTLRRDAKCLVALAVMRLALSTAGYGAIRARMPQAAPTPDGHFYARQLARRIERRARLIPGASCLTQALALQYLLAREGHGSSFHLGVRRDAAGRFDAHAWVSCNGHIVLGAATTRLDDFTILPEAR